MNVVVRPTCNNGDGELMASGKSEKEGGVESRHGKSSQRAVLLADE
jgi:hypothetical protein